MQQAYDFEIVLLEDDTIHSTVLNLVCQLIEMFSSTNPWMTSPRV